MLCYCSAYPLLGVAASASRSFMRLRWSRQLGLQSFENFQIYVVTKRLQLFSGCSWRPPGPLHWMPVCPEDMSADFPRVRDPRDRKKLKMEAAVFDTLISKGTCYHFCHICNKWPLYGMSTLQIQYTQENSNSKT